MTQIIKYTFDTEEQWHELRSRNIGSSECEALVGVQKYSTYFTLWHQKKGNIDAVDFDENDRVFWGAHMEPAIAAGLAKQHELEIEKVREYYEIDDQPGIGASLDYKVKSGNVWVPFEIKNVDRLVWIQEWNTDADPIEPPLHIQVQVQHQMLVTGSDHAFIGALVGGNEAHLIRVERHDKIIAAIRKAATRFWASQEADAEPDVPLDDHAAENLDTIQKVWVQGVGEAVLDASTLEDSEAVLIKAAIEKYATGANMVKGGEALKDEAKISLMKLAGSYGKIISEWGSFNCNVKPEREEPEKVVPAKTVKARRNALVYPKKAKA